MHIPVARKFLRPLDRGEILLIIPVRLTHSRSVYVRYEHVRPLHKGKRLAPTMRHCSLNSRSDLLPVIFISSGSDNKMPTYERTLSERRAQG